MENIDNQNVGNRTGEYGGGDMKKPWKPILYVLIICIILGLYISFKVGYFNKPEVQKVNPNTKQVLDDGTLISFETKTIFEENKENRYTIDVKYPTLIVSTSSSRQLNQTVQRINKKIESTVKDFVTEAKKDFVEAMKEDYIKQSSIDFTLNAEYTTSMSKRFNSASVQLEVYEYAGGAHGITTPTNLTFILNTGKEIKLQDLFIKDSDYLDRLSVKSIEKLRAMDPNLDTYTDIETGASANIENFVNFSLDDDSLIIKFSDYQVGPYVSGRPVIKIPFTELDDLLVKTI